MVAMIASALPSATFGAASKAIISPLNFAAGGLPASTYF